jgi:glycopeptide antibiotics resistance protein
MSVNINFEIGAAPVLGPALAAFGAVLYVRMRKGRPGWTGAHALTRATAALYAAGVVYLTLLPIVVTYGPYANQMPWTSQIMWVPVISPDPSILANVFLTIPLGVLLPLMSSRATSWGRVTLMSLAVSLTIEVTQLLVYVVCNNARLTDVADLMTNTLGGLLGYAALAGAARVQGLAGLLDTLALPGSAFAERRRRTAGPRPVDTAPVS